MKFIVFADLHQGIMPDARARLETIVRAAEMEDVDFIVNMGDFISNFQAADSVDERWHSITTPHYIVAGNHDFDFYDEDGYKINYNLANPYYLFEDDDFRYIVLDTNYFREADQDHHYAYANFYGEKKRGIGRDQLEWLTQKVEQTTKKCIIFGHAQIKYLVEKTEPACTDYQGVHERLVALNQQAGYQKVCLVLNGHNHTDTYACWDGIHYLGINSASNQWLGESLAWLEPNTVYPQEMHEKYTYLKYVAPYQDALYAILSYDPEINTFSVKGKESCYIGPEPAARGHKGTMGGFTLTPSITSKTMFLSSDLSGETATTRCKQCSKNK